jgi:hypothetical protein
MDCVIVRRAEGIEAVETRRVRRGDLVAVGLAENGTQGIVVHTEGFMGAHSANEFRFMSTEVSRERPVNYEDLARRIEDERRAGGYLIWVPGPALVHSRARADFSGSFATDTCRPSWRGTRLQSTTWKPRSSAPRLA